MVVLMIGKPRGCHLKVSNKRERIQRDHRQNLQKTTENIGDLLMLTKTQWLSLVESVFLEVHGLEPLEKLVTHLEPTCMSSWGVIFTGK
jgi:hypothetical protein